MPNKLSLAQRPCRWHLCTQDIHPARRDPSFGPQHPSAQYAASDHRSTLPPSPHTPASLASLRCTTGGAGGHGRNGIQGRMLRALRGIECPEARRLQSCLSRALPSDGLRTHTTVTEQSHPALPDPRQCTGHSHYATSSFLSFHLSAHTHGLPYNSLALLTPCLLTRQLPPPHPPPNLLPPVCDGPTTPDTLFCGAGSPSNDDNLPLPLTTYNDSAYLVIPSEARHSLNLSLIFLAQQARRHLSAPLTMRLHFASLVALAVSAQAAWIPITPRSEARHLANQAVGQAGEARAFHAHHVMPRSGSGHAGAGLRKVRRLKRGRTCKPRPSSGSAYASPTATPAPHSSLVDTGKEHSHKSKTKSEGGYDDGMWHSSSKTDDWDSWMSTTEEGSAEPTSTGDEWSGSSSSASHSASASASASEGGDDWSSSATESASAKPSETGSGGSDGNSNNSSHSGGNNNQTPGNGDGGLFPVEGIKLFTTAKKSTSAPGFQLNGETPSEDYDPKTCKSELH